MTGWPQEGAVSTRNGSKTHDGQGVSRGSPAARPVVVRDDRYASTVPLTLVTVPPPTQIAPDSSADTCTRPRRPIAVP
jgi:hypothetical protein